MSNHKVLAIMKIDGEATEVTYYDGPDLAKALVAVGQAATRDSDPRTATLNVELILGTA